MFKIKTLRTPTNSTSKHCRNLVLGICVWLLAPLSHADILSMPDGERSSEALPLTSQDLPTRGISMDQVRMQYGLPEVAHPAVGDPPITRWDYAGFSVFFEYQHVLHSVIPEKPKPIYNKEELNTGY